MRDVALNSPFPLDTSPSGRPKAIEIRSKEQMTERDREEVAGAESSIQEHAGFAGIDFNRGNWSYRQIDCRAFPNHIFLTYTRNNGVGDVSVFSAAIPRSGEDQVRIIPIQLRGYSLFSPAPINALTISAFNHIRADEPTRESTDWLGTGLCYAALAGARVQLPELSADGGKEKLPRGTGAIMEIPSQGGAVIRFVDAAAAPRPMEWTLTFNGKGHLLKAAHLPAATVTAKPVPQMAANAR